VQAARSGRQNIAEGSRASATSTKTELRLVNVARASLDELLLDYEDFLRQRRLRQWEKGDREAQAVREVGRRNRTDRSDQSDAASYSEWLAHADSAVVANGVICLIHQANYLLDRQIAALELAFIHEGGYSEQLAAARLTERARQRRTDQIAPAGETAPACPSCGTGMELRTARKGARAGSRFWSCAGYPECKGTKPFEAASESAGASDRSVGSV
jgi:Zn-finger domain associated with topoisomerase type I